MPSENSSRGLPRKTLNVRLLIVSVVVALILGAAGYFWHAAQVSRLKGALLERADQLAEQKLWREASTYLFRYLQLDPSNAAIRIRLAETFDRAALAPAAKRRAVDLYYRAVGVASDRPELRARLAELLWEQGTYGGARQQADAVLQLDPDHAGAKSVRALAMYGAARFGLVPREEAFAELVRVAEEQPRNLVLAETLARIYREEWTSLDPTDRNRRADQLMDRLVAADPENIDTHLARHRYRTRYGLPGAEADLAELQQRAPDEPRVLAACGEWAMKCRRPEEARKHYAALLQQAPDSPLGCLGLGEALVTLGEPAEALRTWRRGLERDPSNIPLNYRLADFLVQQGDLDAAAGPLQKLEQAFTSLAAAPGAETNETVRSLRPAVELLRAQWLLGRGQISGAENRLRRIAGTGVEQMRQEAAALPAIQARLLLAERYVQQARWDQAAAAYEAVAEQFPDNAEARLGAAGAWAALGQFDPAIRHCRQLLASKNPPPRAYLELARLQWRRQLVLPPGQRDARIVQAALSAAEAAADGWELRLLKADILAAAAPSDAIEPALAVLSAAEQDFPDVTPLWLQLAFRYQAWGRAADGERAFAEYEKRTSGDPGALIAKAQWLAASGELDAAERLLEEAWRESTDVSRSRAALLLTQWHRARGAADKGRAVLSEQLQDNPDDLSLLVQAADLAWEAADLAAAERYERELSRLEGPDGSFWKFCRARRLASRASSVTASEFQQARQLSAEIQSARPSWPKAALLRAQLAERTGDPEQAIQAYQTAVALGERGVGALERLIRLLYDQRRFAEAERYLSDFLRAGAPGQQVAVFEAAIAASRGQVERAVEIARNWAQQHPDDPLAYVSLGHVLLLYGDAGEAETEFQRAVTLAPSDMRVWAALFYGQLRNRKTEAAGATLERIAHEAQVSEADRSFLLAQGYQALGNTERAAELFGAAEKLAPESVAVKLDRAMFLLERDPAEAERLLRDARKLDAENGEVRRSLVGLLASRGDERSWQEALSLLGNPAAGQRAPEDIRLHAALLIRRNRADDRRVARQLLETLAETPTAIRSGDRIMLAQLYAAEGRDAAARQQYLAAVEQPNVQVGELAAYIEFLLQKDRNEEVVQWIEKLQSIAPDSLATIGFRARWLHATGRDAQLESEVEASAQRLLDRFADPADPTRLQVMRSIAETYVRVEQSAAAERWLRQLADTDPGQYAALAQFLAQRERLEEAVRICLAAHAREEAADPVYVLLGVLSVAGPDATQETAVEPVLQSALDKFPQDGRLLFLLGNFRLRQQQVEAAVTLFRRATEATPENYFAWNNLACLLADVPEKRGEAMRLIDRALDIAGARVPLLIDTKATLLMHLGKPREAAALLEEIVASEDRDPRYLFHLALAYDQLGMREQAARSFKAAQDSGLARTYLSQQEQEQVAQLDRRLQRK